MSFLKWVDLTRGASANIPSLPAEGAFALERGREVTETSVLGGKAIVQFGAFGPGKFRMQIELWGDEGDQFYRAFVLPAYGSEKRPASLVQVIWGTSSEDAFSGRMGGMPETQHIMGASAGEIFSRSLSIELIDTVRPQYTRLARGKGGAYTPVQAPTLTHVRVEGETLFDIAKQYGCTMENIAELNGGNPQFRADAKTKGTKLIVPKKAKR
jgi:LysM domain